MRLKAFEEVVADLLPHVTPSFVQLPPVPSSSLNEESWPFDSVPPAGQVSGSAPGQLSGKRAKRKEGQLRSLLRCIIAMLPVKDDDKKKVTIVDFCGGTGHLALPLALLLPQCDVVIVDLKAASLNFVHQKARQRAKGDSRDDSTIYAVYNVGKDVTQHDHIKRQCDGIPNLYTFHGSIEKYSEGFDVGVALHACGEASDIVLRTCGAAKANFVVSSCCVGKLNRNVLNPYIYHATAENDATISYPQSCVFSNLLTSKQWDVLAKAADYSDLSELRTARNATRRTAKSLLETDRLLYMKEQYGYQTCLSRMDPWESSPKNDILMGWFEGHDSNESVGSPYRHSLCRPCLDCNAEVQLSKEHLLSAADCKEFPCDSVDWTWKEEEETTKTLEEFVNSSERKRIFPTGMASRHRKLVHYKAEQMGLAHWCEGKKYASKTVVVAKRSGEKFVY